MNVKYLSGNKKDTIVDLDEVKAKSLVEDGLAVEVKAEDPMDIALKNLDTKINEAVTKASKLAAENTVNAITKGLGNQRIVVGPDRELADPNGGYKSFNEFCLDVYRSGINLSNPTLTMKSYIQRTKTAGATPYVSEGSVSVTAGTNDGAVIPIQMASEIFKMYGNQNSFSQLCFPFAMNSLSAKLPVQKNYSRANSTAANGIVVNESGEGNVIPYSKTNWEQRIFTLVKEGVIVPVSNESLDDNNVGLGNAIASMAMYQLNKQINGGIIQGYTSSCTGIIGASATKIVGRATNGAIGFADIVSMYASFDHEGADYDNAYWLCHPNTLASWYNSTVGNYPAFLTPGGGVDGKPTRIMGRPLILTGWAKGLGTTGDLLLVDFKKYIVGYKGGVESFVSPHVFMTSDQTGFRFTQRLNGQLGLTGLVTLEDGSTTVSPFVELGQVGGAS